MGDYFKGPERLEVFSITGAPMRMGEPRSLEVPDYQVLKNLIAQGEKDKAIAYLSAFHAQNSGMLSLLNDWCVAQVKLCAELLDATKEKNLRPEAMKEFNILIDKMALEYHSAEDKAVLDFIRKYITAETILFLDGQKILEGLNQKKDALVLAITAGDKNKAIIDVDHYHHHDLICHDSLITFIYSYPTTVMKHYGEKMGMDISNESILRNPIWNGMWELTKVLTPLDLAAFLAEHLRFHFSGPARQGQTIIKEDDKKINLIFDPCGSGGALRRRLGDDIVNFKEKHQLGWNKCGEVNMYCSHCAINEKHSIDLFGYPKLVVEFQADPAKPCGWTIYKNKEDIPAEVYERLGLKK
ncbi:hypothetical protein DOM21_11780 [Bacteriovorax stolpii]|uniref:Uncharacterized protein n=1 Tax=Bacteriovorax stolpii TaxID=960 RepID=A0A2K9NQU1_BACTC|nr:hypothetical protein [Bacteriovorax stolpii]AUN97900.1 hypothetical protein C0V70_07220 [Bacteriovorax stolpii]QDK42114.1 hypothetical protein DOM21_11780 [Bacteriovorax stolpii]TDP51731.1 hypothetical protein C8D79_3176 [Bacteriovorax stolpii]